ncbi:MAG: hypothetical protein NC118_14635 [Eubacterium sp.]|nr:hypothetical protein [Eubacterium sp.]
MAELEKYGYLVREQFRNEKGHYTEACYTIYETPKAVSENPEKENTEPENDYDSQPICQNGLSVQSTENTGFLPICQNRRTENRRAEKRITEKGGQLNTNILNNTKELNTYSSSSSTYSDEVQKEMRKTQILDDEARDRLWKQFELERIAAKSSHELAKTVFDELCKRDAEFINLMNGKALEQVCLSIMEIQKREPVRMLPNLINTCLDNIICGIRASGVGRRDSPNRYDNAFNHFPQNQYDFAGLEKELLSN